MKNFLLILIVSVLAFSCDDLLSHDSMDFDIEGTPMDHEQIVLGDRLEDPYSIENITKAINSLYPTKAGRVEITPTDYYVRFLPSDDLQFGVLEDLGLVMLDHPVDYQILREGDYYHDPEIAQEDITWQYSVVPADFEFPKGIKYEILDRCYLAEHDSEQTKSSPGIDWDLVERESYRLSGNEDLLAPVTKSGSGRPSGRITVLDSDFSDNPIPVRGMRVSCNTFVKFDHAYTNDDGYYQMSKSFSSNPRYRLVFKNSKGFAIGLNLLIVPASVSTLGKNPPEGLDMTVTSKSDRKLFSRVVVSNAAYDYYESCGSGTNRIKTPPSNLRLWLFQNMSSSCPVMMQQGAVIDGSKLAGFLGEFTWIVKMFLPDITLGLRGMDSYADIYASTVHQLAHASHFMQVGKAYWTVYVDFLLKSFISAGFTAYGTGTEENHGYCEMAEMWAYYMQNMMFKDRYPSKKETFGTSFWFSPQILMNLDERGLDKYKIFAAFTSDIYEVEKLQKKLVSLNPTYKSTINQAFGRYTKL